MNAREKHTTTAPDPKIGAMGLRPRSSMRLSSAPNDTPEWMHNRAALWNAVEAIEKRRDAQLSREIQLSLPHELNDVQRRELVHGFVQSAFVSKGMIADVGIHRPDAHGDNRNHHAHIMLTMRELTAEGFNSKKARHWNDKKHVPAWREQWAKAQNKMLEQHGHVERVTHLSLKDQGIHQIAQIHLGTAANQLMKRGADHPRVERHKAVQQRNVRLKQRQRTSTTAQCTIGDCAQRTVATISGSRPRNRGTEQSD